MPHQDDELLRQRIHYLIEQGGLVAPDNPAIERRRPPRQRRSYLLAGGIIVGLMAGAITHTRRCTTRAAGVDQAHAYRLSSLIFRTVS
jgi:hypothetical protein